MYLDVGREVIETEVSESAAAGAAKRSDVFAAWEDWPASEISHHGKLCCEIAREWVTATDFTALYGGDLLTGPRWLRHRFKWGASVYPIFWCEAVRKKTLDCGALAAMSHEVFAARGVRSFRAQLVQRFSGAATEQWSCSWGKQGAPLDWIKGDVIYHEGCAVRATENRVRIWDSSAGWWIDPKRSDGYGSLLAIRITGADGLTFQWGGILLTSGKWQQV